MKQTAVEYLIEEINKLVGIRIRMDEPIIEQAKQMEQEQIEDAFNSGMNNSVDYFIPEDDISEATEYYNQTYKNEAQTTS